MNLEANSVNEYLEKVPEERKIHFNKLRRTILENIPTGFEEVLSYGMIGYVVPFEKFPAGYHCNPKLPLPFLNVASQKNFIAIYHMGIYASPELLEWFVEEYKKVTKTKLDMGKSCIRFKKPENIPFELIGELVRKISVDDWINTYNNVINKK